MSTTLLYGVPEPVPKTFRFQADITFDALSLDEALYKIWWHFDSAVEGLHVDDWFKGAMHLAPVEPPPAIES